MIYLMNANDSYDEVPTRSWPRDPQSPRMTRSADLSSVPTTAELHPRIQIQEPLMPWLAGEPMKTSKA